MKISTRSQWIKSTISNKRTKGAPPHLAGRELERQNNIHPKESNK